MYSETKEAETQKECMTSPIILGDRPPRNRSTIISMLKSSCQKFFSVKTLKRKLPILEWLPKYNTHYFISDLIAGITVGLTLIPQAIAYADLAGLPVQYGLYSSFMSVFLYTIFGSIRQLSLGPAAIMALLVYDYSVKGGPSYTALLCFMCGILQLVFTALNLGILANLISTPVTSAFVTAAAVIISSAQLKNLLGLKLTGTNVFHLYYKLFENIKMTNLWDLAMGVSAIIVIILLKNMKESPYIKKSNNKEATRCQRVFGKVVWIISTSRNIIVVLIGSSITASLGEDNPFSLTGKVEKGLPEIRLPSFSQTVNNQTMDFGEVIQDCGSSVLVMTLIAVLSTLSIGKAFSKGQPIDASQEILALGIINVVSSFFGSFPVCPSFGRSALNESSGISTPLGGIYTGMLVILALVLITPYCFYIPKPALAAVIMTAVYYINEFHILPKMVKAKKLDAVCWVITFMFCLFLGADMGILLGIATSLAILIFGVSSMKIKVEKTTTSDLEALQYMEFDRNILFPNANYTIALMSKHLARSEFCKYITFDFGHVSKVDFTSIKVFVNYIELLSNEGRIVQFTNVNPAVRTVFENIGYHIEDERKQNSEG